MYLCESVFVYDETRHNFDDIADFVAFLETEWSDGLEFFEARRKNWFATGKIIIKESVFSTGQIVFYTGFDCEDSCNEYMNESGTVGLTRFFTKNGIILSSRQQIDHMPDKVGPR